MIDLNRYESIRMSVRSKRSRSIIDFYRSGSIRPIRIDPDLIPKSILTDGSIFIGPKRYGSVKNDLDRSGSSLIDFRTQVKEDESEEGDFARLDTAALLV